MKYMVFSDGNSGIEFWGTCTEEMKLSASDSESLSFIQAEIELPSNMLFGKTCVGEALIYSGPDADNEKDFIVAYYIPIHQDGPKNKPDFGIVIETAM